MNLEALKLLPRTGTEPLHDAGTALGFVLAVGVLGPVQQPDAGRARRVHRR
jgi:hypothetical protein